MSRSVSWDGHKNKGCKTLNVSRAKHGHAHVTRIDMLTLQFTTPAARPCTDRHALKKRLACSRCRRSLSSTVTLVCWLATSVTLGRISGRYSCHSAKCNTNRRGWGENSGATVHRDHTHCWLGWKGWAKSCNMIMSCLWFRRVWHVRDWNCHYTIAHWTKEKPGPLLCIKLLPKSPGYQTHRRHHNKDGAIQYVQHVAQHRR